MPSSDPVRPGAPQTESGRPLREVASYTRRGSRLTPKQAAAWTAYAEQWVVHPDLAESRPVSEWFGPDDRGEAPLIVEIGSGIGEAAVAIAAARPEARVLAFEVWKPGVAAGLARAGEAGVTNLRFCQLDAVWALREAIAPGQIAELVTFFPDPWHKKRHHKRRLITPDFARLAAGRVAPGGIWRIATDWPDYADHIAEALDQVSDLWVGGPSERWAGRPVTKFERRGLAEGRAIADFCFTRSDDAVS